MATKDWKKGKIEIDGDYPYESWYNKKDDGGVNISKYSDGLWYVNIRKEGGNIQQKFKTKSQALSFAKQYMRTH